MSDFFITKDHFLRAVRILRPDLGQKELGKMWREFVSARAKHYKLKASLRIIQGGKNDQR